MDTLVVTTSISRKAGGLFDAVRGLCRGLQGYCSMAVLSLRDEFSVEDQKAWLPLQPVLYDHRGPIELGYSSQLAKYMERTPADIIHSHGVWMYPSIAASMGARRRGIPFVMSPHGMLDPWALSNSRWKKRLVGVLCANTALRSAACIHALCESEYESIRAYGLRNPVCIIPNGVDLPEDESQLASPWADIVNSGRKVIFFLGRLHPKKGLPNLIEAWARVRQCSAGITSEWTLVIAGWSQNRHEEELKRMVAEKGLSGEIIFMGPVFDGAKKACFQNAGAFILPSFSEGLPMSVLEAWSYGLPVIMTTECNIPEGFTGGAAIEIGPDVKSIEQGLGAFLSRPHTEQKNMGVKGRRLVETRFAWSRSASQMIDVYKWCLEQGSQPECVRLD